MGKKGLSPVNKLTTEEYIRRFNALGFEEYELVSEYNGAIKPVNIKHKKCNTIFPLIARNIIDNKSCICPKCFPNGNNKCIPHINDLYITNPEVYNLLKNKEDGHKYKAFSSKKTYFICPTCGKELFKNICNVTIRGLICDRCSDGISYPEKFMMKLLEQYIKKYDYQWSPEWIKPYRYDFHFDYMGKEYIVETDGKFHYEDNKLDGRTLEEINAVDAYKNKMATINNIHIIRINADYNNINDRDNVLIKNIKLSELNNIFDLSMINYDECKEFAMSSLVLKIGELWNSGIDSYDEISTIMHLSESTIRQYIMQACEMNIINSAYDDIKKKHWENTAIKIGNKVFCNETKEIFNSYKEADRKYGSYVSIYFSKELNYSGTLPDGTKLTWTKLN